MATAGFPADFGRPGWSAPRSAALLGGRARRRSTRCAPRRHGTHRRARVGRSPTSSCWRPCRGPARSSRSAATIASTPPRRASSRRRPRSSSRSGRARSSARAPTSAGIRGSLARSTTRRSSPSSSAGRRGGSALTPRSTTCSGYTCLNDVSARDLQFGDGQWVRGKSLDTFCPMGPVLVTADEIGDPQDLAIRCTVDGEVVQDAQHVADVLLGRRDHQLLLGGRSRSSPATSSRPARRPASASSAIRRASSATATASSSRSRASAGSRTPAGSTAARRPHDRAGRAQRAVPRHRRARLHRRVDGARRWSARASRSSRSTSAATRGASPRSSSPTSWTG